MKQNEFKVLYCIKKSGDLTIREIAQKCKISVGETSQIKKRMKEAGYLNDEGITPSGVEALAPYKVDNAVIMAAGMASRFVPLSLEMPKGLLSVKGEILIERQIEQLKAAGIDDIIIVLGYKKEAFFYLEKKYGVKIVINPYFNVKNNPYTLYLVREHLKNTYICSSDNYFRENVFEDYVYDAYYASVHVTERTSEWYMKKGAGDRIVSVKKTGTEGDVMLGHVYWDREFSAAMVRCLEEAQTTGEYDETLWEQILVDKVKSLPPMMVRTYPNDVIFEFDSLDELRRFDEKYVRNTHSKILKNICSVLGCDESEIVDFDVIKEGLTNTSFVFEVRGKKYVYRHPGDGTETIISRQHEKMSLEIAKRVGVDPTYIYMNSEEGWKISSYVSGIRMPDYDNFEDSKRVIKVLRDLHERKMHVDWAFRPFEDAFDIERQILEKTQITIPDYEEIKERVTKLYDIVKKDGVKPVFCHCDTYKPNWMLTDTETILIDWEYSGEADPGCDLAAYIMDAMYPVETSKKFIAEYLQDTYTKELEFHHLAYVAIVSFYWFVWAIYREACGAVMGDSLHNWYVMARDYSAYLVENM